MANVQNLFRQFAVPVFLPFVVGQHADDSGSAKANQTYLQFGHVYS
jgi:hypothetical protein